MSSSSSQLLPRMKRELEILERDPPPGVICYPVDDSLLKFCALIKGPKDTPYEDGLFKVDVQIPSRYPMEPPKMQFITPIYHPNVDDAGRICLDLLKMPPMGSWKPSLNISTTLTSLSVLMADPNPDDPLLVEIASEFKENKSLFLQKARQATLRHAMEDKKALNPENLVQEPEQASSSSSNSASNASVCSLLPDIQQETTTQSSQNKIASQEAELGSISKNINKTEERIITQKKEKKKILSLSKAHSKIEKKLPLEQASNHSKTEKKLPLEQASNNPKIKKNAPLEQNDSKIEKNAPLAQNDSKKNALLELISDSPTSDPTFSTSIKTTTLNLNSSRSLKLLQEEKGKQVETRKPLGDITKNSVNVPSLNDRAERKRKLLRKKTPSDASSKKQKN
ncbi:ubiquitin-conjugating enzyme/RWD-like protein [Rhizophagus diaphanus]|nr:ubiquitin-conjugating enzyme/RWD-like protein [Rhizophagus diaphanus] [Rhizophagus sp. MUCL 43196]